MLGEVISYLAAAILGGIGSLFLLFIKNRRPLLLYNVNHNRVGMTATDKVLGNVEVRYNDSVVHNLFISNVELKNCSITDLGDVAFRVYRGEEEIAILTEQTQIVGTLESVKLTDEYFDRVRGDRDWEQGILEAGTADEVANQQRLNQDASFRHGQRQYLIPVLNRGQVARFTYLTQVAHDVKPILLAESQTKGVRLDYGPHHSAITHVLEIPVKNAALAGFVVSPIIAAVLIWQIQTAWIVATACFVTGVLISIEGALVIKLWRWVRDKLAG